MVIKKKNLKIFEFSYFVLYLYEILIYYNGMKFIWKGDFFFFEELYIYLGR